MNDRNSNEDSNNLSFRNLVIVNRLGRGSTSHVFKTQSIRSKKYYAMKVIDKSIPQFCQASLSQQIQTHRKLKHKHISQFLKHFEDDHNHYIVTQYCKDGEITKYLLRPMTQKRILQVLFEVSSALHYMHNQAGFAHGDLKLSNILINGSELKLCDFGFSANLNAKSQLHKPSNGPYGTLIYMSPEILKNNANLHYKEADVWALGICLLTLMMQAKPYKAQQTSQLKQQIINGDYIRPTQQSLPQFSPQLIRLVQRMLEVDHQKRINIQQILNHQILGKLRQSKKNQTQEDKNYVEMSENQTLEINQQKEGLNKSVFNLTVDTLPESEQSIISNKANKIISYCLKPQLHRNGEDGSIEILDNRSIKIKVKKIQYMISADGNTLQICKGTKGQKIYTFQQLQLSEKIADLYNYGAQLVNILKKKQCFQQCFIAGKYFWISKKSIGCLIQDRHIVQRNFGQNQITCIQINSIHNEKTIINKNNQLPHFLKIFEAGEKYLFNNNKR